MGAMIWSADKKTWFWPDNLSLGHGTYDRRIISQKITSWISKTCARPHACRDVNLNAISISFSNNNIYNFFLCENNKRNYQLSCFAFLNCKYTNYLCL